MYAKRNRSSKLQELDMKWTFYNCELEEESSIEKLQEFVKGMKKKMCIK